MILKIEKLMDEKDNIVVQPLADGELSSAAETPVREGSETEGSGAAVATDKPTEEHDPDCRHHAGSHHHPLLLALFLRYHAGRPPR